MINEEREEKNKNKRAIFVLILKYLICSVIQNSFGIFRLYISKLNGLLILVINNKSNIENENIE